MRVSAAPNRARLRRMRGRRLGEGTRDGGVESPRRVGATETPSLRSPAQDARETRAFRGLAAGSILLALGVLFVHVPAQVYEVNVEERLHSLPELLITGVAILAVLALVLAAPLWLRSRRTIRALAVAWFPLAVCVWVSSSFLVLA